MDRCTRLFVFPGGLLEVADYGDENDGPGVYLELPTPADRVLSQRVPGAAVVDHRVSPVEPADAETCATVLRLLQDLP
ncbi:hypothetical protein [Nocardia pseudovaccinii]|uniref:hypothetical protein n=1 Tax=Nocardia pseudovaccinii TaxID=189540 RepID=UPI0007A3896D|nr:hypothetical protein [Nocardia pseudovaccinii]